MAKLVQLTSLLFVLFVYKSSYAQNGDWNKVTLSIEQQPIRELLASVKQQTRLQFSFNSRLINQDSIVSYHCKNKKLKHVFADISNDRLTSKRIGTHIILIENERAIEKQQKKRVEQRTHTFSGVVVHARNGAPVVKASIYDTYTRSAIVSDHLGKFGISAVSSGKSKTYVISKKGFRDTIISLNHTRKDVKIRLIPLPEQITKLEKKETRFLSTEQKSDFLYGFVPMDALITSENLRNVYEKRVSQVSFLPRVGTNWMSSGVVGNSISLNILAGYNGNLHGVEIGGTVNILNQSAKGLQIAGLTNLVGKNVVGAQVAGLLNKNGGYLRGAQVGGLMNWVTGKATGMQIAGLINRNANAFAGAHVAGLMNWTKGGVKGIQIAGLINLGAKKGFGTQVAGLLNVNKEKFSGVQIAGIANIVRGKVKGFQLSGLSNIINNSDSLVIQTSGLLNWSSKNLRGLQLSGLVNVAKDTLRGVQLSGLFNKVKNNHGVQIGLVNISEEASGIAIGLVNYVENGYRSVEISSNEAFLTNLTYKMGSRHFYTIYTVGIGNPETQLFRLGFGFGTNIPITNKLSFTLDGTASIYAEKVENLSHNMNNRLDLLLNFQPSKRFYFALGPAFNANINFNSKESQPEFSSLISPFYSETGTNNRNELTLGASYAIGIRF